MCGWQLRKSSFYLSERWDLTPPVNTDRPVRRSVLYDGLFSLCTWMHHRGLKYLHNINDIQSRGFSYMLNFWIAWRYVNSTHASPTLDIPPAAGAAIDLRSLGTYINTGFLLTARQLLSLFTEGELSSSSTFIKNIHSPAPPQIRFPLFIGYSIILIKLFSLPFFLRSCPS